MCSMAAPGKITPIDTTLDLARWTGVMQKITLVIRDGKIKGVTDKPGLGIRNRYGKT